jgi:hypothetical protein
VIAIVKLVPGELSLDLLGGSDEKSRNVVPKKINELVVGDNDQHIGPRLLHIATQRRKSSFSIFAQLLLLIERRPRGGTLGRHAVMKIHKIFPLGSGFEENIGSMTRSQGRD